MDNKLYLELYESYKEIKEERLAKKWGDFEIKVINGVKGILDNFESVDEKNSKISKPLRISKNRNPIEFMNKINEENKKEKLQNLPKKYEPLNNAEEGNNIDFEENP